MLFPVDGPEIPAPVVGETLLLAPAGERMQPRHSTLPLERKESLSIPQIEGVVALPPPSSSAPSPPPQVFQSSPKAPTEKRKKEIEEEKSEQSPKRGTVEVE